MKTTCLLAAAALVVASLSARADGPKTDCQDTSAITWFTPGSFPQAKAKAAKENRILIIKGIAFGIDAVGAKCATKGCW